MVGSGRSSTGAWWGLTLSSVKAPPFFSGPYDGGVPVILDGRVASGWSRTASDVVAAGPLPSGGLTGAVASLIPAGEQITSTTYADLPTVGPQVTLTPGASGTVIVLLSAEVSAQNFYGTQQAFMTVALSGGNTLAAADANALSNMDWSGGNSQDDDHAMFMSILTGLAAASTTFTAKYRYSIASGFGFFAARSMVVIPL